MALTPMLRGLIVLAAVSLIASCSVPFQAPASTGEVAGTVLGWPAAPTGGDTTPARNARVTLLDADGHDLYSASTDDRGRYRQEARPGEYVVHVAAFGFDAPIIESANGVDVKTKVVRVTIRAGETTRLDLVVFTGIL